MTMISEEIKNSDCYKYADDVINGKIIACDLIKCSCKRFIKDLEREDLEFRIDIGKRFEEFCGLVKHFKGNAIGKPFVLENWQKFLIYNILCFYYKETNTRRFKQCILSISRKQGKTAISAMLCLWFLLCDNEGAPECSLAANSASQASVAFEFCENFARQIDPKSMVIKRFRNNLKTEFNMGKLNVFAADASRLDGRNPSFILCDEMGAAKDADVYNVLRSGQGQRKQPLAMIISTAGFDLSGPFYKMIQTGKEVLRGVKENDSFFYMIFELDEGDDYTEEKNWKKVMPNLGISCEYDFVKEEIQNVKNDVQNNEVSVLTKTFNTWCSSSTTWISHDYITKSMQEIKFEDFDNETFVWVGVDLASTSDLTAVSFLMQKNEEEEKIYFKTLYFLPEETIKTSPNKIKYQYWQRTNQLIVTPGNCTDYDYIINYLQKVNNKLIINTICYDQWNSTFFVIKCTELGLPMRPYSQSIASMNRPTKSLERLIKMGKIVIDKNEITSYCFANSTPKFDWNENIKIVKGGGKDQKIDGTIAMIMAMGGFIEAPRYSNEILILN